MLGKIILASVLTLATVSGIAEDKVVTPTEQKVVLSFDMTPYLDMTPQCKDGVCPTQPAAKSSSCANGSCSTVRTTQKRTYRTWKGPFGRTWKVYRRR